MHQPFKFQNLAGSPNKSCNVISFRGTTVIFDCTLDFMSTLGYMPLSLTHSQQLSSLPNWSPPSDRVKSLNLNYKETRSLNYEVKECSSVHGVTHCVDSAPEFALFDTESIDISQIDVVLISNYLNMFALPYLTEKLGYDGVIYVTEPSFHFGRIMMEELMKLIERTPRPNKLNLWKRMHDQLNLCIPRSHVMNRDPNSWLTIYSSKELNSCLSKLKVVNFSQSIDIFGLYEVSAHSSGYCIGSCNWVLKSDHEKIVYMSQTSLLTTHPKPFDSQPLQDADVMILTNLTPSPLLNPDTMLGDFCSHTIQALRSDGNVLIPCYPCGTVYDLIECIAGQLAAANLNQVPIYFLSPVAESSLAYANILGEWLTTSKSEKVFVPDEPFIHSSLVRAGKLKHFTSVSDPAFNEAFKCPCVVFSSHPSLRFGDVVHFMQLWGQSSKNLLVLTEPDYPWQEAVNPYLPLNMRILYIPIDTNWNFKQANNRLNNDLKPANLILHNSYVSRPPASFYNAHGFTAADLMIEIQNLTAEEAASASGSAVQPQSNKPRSTAVHPYNYRGLVELTDVKTNYERLTIDSQFAMNILQSEIRPGVSFATVSGALVARDNKFVLYPIEKAISKRQLSRQSGSKALALPPNSYYYGNINFQLLMELIARSGITDAVVEGAKNGKFIELKSMKAVIHVEESQTNIITADRNIRLMLRELITSCLKKF